MGSLRTLSKRGSLKKAFDYIESLRFGAEMGIASGFGTVTSIMEENKFVLQLTGSSSQSLWIGDAIYSRIACLSSVKIDVQYAHPHDHALTAYLWILYKTNKELSRRAASVILTSDNLFWSRILARHIIYGTALLIGA